MFSFPPKKTEVLILKGCTFKIYCSKNRCVGKLEGKSLVAQVSNVVNGYFMPDSLVP